jgi:hypothetical protein
VSGHRLELIWGLAISFGAASQLLARLSGLPAVAWLAHRLAGLDLPVAVVFSAIVLSTGPTVISPLVRQMRLEPLRSQLLEAEGLILEPLAAGAAWVLQLAGLGLAALDECHRLIVSWIAPRGILTAAVDGLFALRLDRSNRVDFFPDPGGDGLPLVAQPTLPECDQAIPVKFQTAN